MAVFPRQKAGDVWEISRIIIQEHGLHRLNGLAQIKSVIFYSIRVIRVQKILWQ